MNGSNTMLHDYSRYLNHVYDNQIDITEMFDKKPISELVRVEQYQERINGQCFMRAGRIVIQAPSV